MTCFSWHVSVLSVLWIQRISLLYFSNGKKPRRWLGRQHFMLPTFRYVGIPFLATLTCVYEFETVLGIWEIRWRRKRNSLMELWGRLFCEASFHSFNIVE